MPHALPPRRPKAAATIAAAAIATFAIAAGVAVAQEQPIETRATVGEREVTVKAVAVTESIYVITGQGGHMGLSVGEDGTFLIDDQYAPLSDAIRKVIGQITDEPVRFIVNTHWHSATPAVGSTDNSAECSETAKLSAYSGSESTVSGISHK